LRRIRLKLWLAPNAWLQGNQSTMTGGESSRNGQHCAMLCWLAHSIRWVVITPLGSPVDPDVKRIFATSPGFTRSNACPTAPVGLQPSSDANEVAPRSAAPLVTSAVCGLRIA